MEIKKRIIRGMIFGISIGLVFLTGSCQFSEKVNIPLSLTDVPEHTLIALTPELSMRTHGTTLHTQYLRLHNDKEFPLVGILRVNGKSYRFMGGDSLRVLPLAPLSNDSCGWNAKFSYLHPGVGWEKQEYDDSQWQKGKGAFGSEHHSYLTHSLWAMNNIYTRRIVRIEDKEVLEKHKLYIRYICDDQMTLYCNGELAFRQDYCVFQTECKQLPDSVVGLLHTGDNVIAAYGHDSGRLALLDFGLYIDNKEYCKADTAVLKQMDVRATQTRYVFECGNVELQLYFVSPGLLQDNDLTECPVGFITYQVFLKEKGTQPTVEILFDMDREWLAEDLLLEMKAEEKNYSYKNGHAIFSQKLGGGRPDSGVLLLGYKDKEELQYEGDILSPSWNKEGKKTLTDMLELIGNRCWDLKSKCDMADARWYQDGMKTKGRNFIEKMIPEYRNFLATHRFVVTPDNQFFCFGNTLGGIRESYSDFPTLMFFNRIDWMKGLLNPIFESCKNIDWVKKYPPYDIGIYPVARRQVNMEDHAIEVAADMLMMTLAIVEAERSFKYAAKYWDLLSQWANYLETCMPDISIISDDMLDSNDERVKRILGYKAYQQLLFWRKSEIRKVKFLNKSLCL